MPNAYTMKRPFRTCSSRTSCNSKNSNCPEDNTAAFEQQQGETTSFSSGRLELNPATQTQTATSTGGRQEEWRKMQNSPLAVSTSTLTTASIEDWSSHYEDDDDDVFKTFNQGDDDEAEDDGFGVGDSTELGDFGDFVSAAAQQEKDFARECLDADGEVHMTESRRKLAKSGFSFNRAKMVKMLSSRSLMIANESDDEDQQDSSSQVGSFADDLSVVHSVSTMVSDYSQISHLSERLRDPNDHDSAAADELKDLTDADIAERFTKMQKKINRRRKKFRKSRSKGMGKRGSLDLSSLTDDDAEAIARRVREHKKERKFMKKEKANRKHMSSKTQPTTIE
jgi:hypothetical protein